MPELIEEGAERYCRFCGNDDEDNATLFEGEHEIFICSRCVRTFYLEIEAKEK